VYSGFDVTNLLSLLVKFISSYSSRLATRTKECIKVKSIMVLKPGMRNESERDNGCLTKAPSYFTGLYFFDRSEFN